MSASAIAIAPTESKPVLVEDVWHIVFKQMVFDRFGRVDFNLPSSFWQWLRTSRQVSKMFNRVLTQYSYVYVDLEPVAKINRLLKVDAQLQEKIMDNIRTWGIHINLPTFYYHPDHPSFALKLLPQCKRMTVASCPPGEDRNLRDQEMALKLYTWAFLENCWSCKFYVDPSSDAMFWENERANPRLVPISGDPCSYQELGTYWPVFNTSFKHVPLVPFQERVF